MLPASTSIISFCQLATAGATAKRQREGDCSPPQRRVHPERADTEGDVKQRRKREARKTFTSEERATQTWRRGGLLPGRGMPVPAPPQRGGWRRRGLRRRDGEAWLPPAPLPPPLAASAACRCSAPPGKRRSILASRRHAAAALGPSSPTNTSVGEVWRLLGPRALFQFGFWRSVQFSPKVIYSN